MILNFIILLSGIVSGFILFQSAINAPLLFKHLTIEQARPILRTIFPILFRVVAAIGGLMFILSLTSVAEPIVMIVTLLTLLLSLVCAMLVPATNRAADKDDSQAFNRLHRISVSLTVVVLVANLAWLALL